MNKKMIILLSFAFFSPVLSAKTHYEYQTVDSMLKSIQESEINIAAMEAEIQKIHETTHEWATSVDKKVFDILMDLKKSNVDVIKHSVEEQKVILERMIKSSRPVKEKMYEHFLVHKNRYMYGTAAVVAVVGGYCFYTWYKARQAKRAVVAQQVAQTLRTLSSEA